MQFFFPAGGAPQWEGGEATATYVLQARVLFTCIFFLGALRNFITNVCTCAHLHMCLLRCIYASLFALIRLSSEPLSISLPLLCSQVESSGVDSKVNRSNYFCDAQ